MFVVLLISIFAAHVAAEIPSYIHVCDYKNQLNQCILDNIHNLRSKLCEGIPELNVPPIGMWKVDKLIIVDSPNINLSLNVDVSGFCNHHINHLIYDIDTNQVEFEIVYDKIKINGTYDLSVRILVPIRHRGNIYISTENLKAVVNFEMKVVTNRGKRYMYVSKIKTNFDIKDYNAKYDSFDGTEMNQLQLILYNFIGSNKQEIIKVFKPALEKKCSEVTLSVANNIIKHFTYNELFPGRPPRVVLTDIVEEMFDIVGKYVPNTFIFKNMLSKLVMISLLARHESIGGRCNSGIPSQNLLLRLLILSETH